MLLLSTLTAVLALPNCDSDTEAHCLGEEMDLSPEGISSCLETLGAKRSVDCSAYLQIMSGCKEDLGSGGICQAAYRDGEAIPCLLQRVKPEQLSTACVAALPKQEEKTGLADKYWADGKRELSKAELDALNEDDRDTYNRWIKRRKGPKTDRDKDKHYAVKKQKLASAMKSVTAQATAAAKAELLQGNKIEAKSAAMKTVKSAMEQAIAEDMTGTLGKFTKSEMTKLANDAFAEAQKSVKNEL